MTWARFQTEFWSIRDNRDVHGTRFQTDNNRNKRPAKDEFRLLKNPPVSDNARNAAGHMPEAEKKDYDDVFDWVVRYTDAMCPSKERLQEYRCSLPDDRLGIGLRDVHFHVVERDCPFCMERLGMIDSPDIPNENGRMGQLHFGPSARRCGDIRKRLGPGGPGWFPSRGSHRPVRAQISAYGSSNHGFAART